MEELLLVCMPLPCSAILTWGLCSVIGVNNAPYYLCFILAFTYEIAMNPAKSSFVLVVPNNNQNNQSNKQQHNDMNMNHIHHTHTHTHTHSRTHTENATIDSKHIPSSHKVHAYREPSARTYIQGTVATSIHTACLLTLPVLFHASLYHHRQMTWLSVSNVALLVVLPTLCVLFTRASQKHRSNGHTLKHRTEYEYEFHAIRYDILVLLSILLLGFQHRVIAHSFSAYLADPPFHLPAYFTHIFLTIAMFCALFAAVLMVSGRIKPLDSVMINMQTSQHHNHIIMFKAAVHVCALCSALVVGVPWYGFVPVAVSVS